MNTLRPLILVVDDETRIRRLVSSNLERSGFDVAGAADGHYAVEYLERADEKPDLILLDVMMPGMDGIACAKIITHRWHIPIIFLTAKNDNTSKLTAFGEGADDYVTKPFSMEELTARIRAVLRRSKTALPDPAEQQILLNGRMTLNLNTRTLHIENADFRLSATEFGLMEILMRDPGAVHHHEELLRRVWGADKTDRVQYLRVAFARLRRKFEEAGLDGGFISAYSGIGYVLRDLRDDE